MKAIETRYKGYRFRSRLEARWAIFFDALGLTWEYEPEGFDFPAQPYRETDGGMSFAAGGRYLPDFLLTAPGRWPSEQSTIWCEVKPHTPNEHEWMLAELLVINTRRSCAFLVGTPDAKAYTVLSPDEGWLRVDTSSMLLWSSRYRFWYEPSDDDLLLYAEKDLHYQRAVHAARAARFEHGETPWIRP